MAERFAFVDGAVTEVAEARVPLADSAFRSGHGCYTTARYERGRLRLAARAAARLARDASALGLGHVDESRCAEDMHALGRACFGEGSGIVRFQASADDAGALRITGTARALGEEPPSWTAVVASGPHPGPSAWSHTKTTNHLPFVLARREAVLAGADEAILVDAAGRVVEGARSNLVVVDEDGTMRTPPLEAGAVRGIARDLLLESTAPVRAAPVFREDLFRARAVLAINGVRGACPIVRIDGEPTSPGHGDPTVASLRTLFDAELG